MKNSEIYSSEKVLIKKKYISPLLYVIEIKIEDAIVANSANVNFGGPNGSTSPYIEDWEEENNGFMREL